MNALRSSLLGAIALFSLAACNVCGGQPVAAGERIGTYDGRAVVIAYAGSDQFKAWMDDLQKQQAAAKEAGNQRLVDEIESKGVAPQQRFHGQAFQGEAIDDVLAVVADALPAILQQAGVTRIERVNAERASNVSTVDVTDQLVALFSPDERTSGWIRDIRGKPFPN